MTAQLLPDTTSLLSRATAAAVSGLSPATRRAYTSHLSRWHLWAPDGPLDRESIKKYLHSLELSGSSAQVRNQALAALKKLASEASELGWISHTTSAQILSLESVKIRGTKTGKWLTRAQLQRLLSLPDRTNPIGRRDACLLALLAGCGLRRSEECNLTVDQVQRLPDGRLLLVNLKGKGGRIRSVSVPRWAQTDIENWMEEIK